MPPAAKKHRVDDAVFTASELRANVARVLDVATTRGKTVLIRRRGGNNAVVMSAEEYFRLKHPLTAALRQTGAAARRAGLDKMTLADINAEIVAARRDRRRKSSGAASRS